jgi:hypothetical protein
MLHGTQSFDGFLVFAGTGAIIGGALFLMLGRYPIVDPAAAEPAAGESTEPTTEVRTP